MERDLSILVNPLLALGFLVIPPCYKILRDDRIEQRLSKGKSAELEGLARLVETSRNIVAATVGVAFIEYAILGAYFMNKGT